LDFQIISEQIPSNKGIKLISKLSNHSTEIENKIKLLERELNLYNNSTQWVDWLNQMYLEIDGVEKLPLDKQKDFLQTYLDSISVQYHS
jgi:hypothetical protein